MTTNNLKRAIGVFPTYQDTENAIKELKNAGFDLDKISAIAKNDPEKKLTDDVEVKSSSERAKEGAETGAVLGATTGSMLGLIGSLSVLAIPGVGIATSAAVLLGNAILGSGIGAAGGTLMGALIGWGIPEEEAKYYEELLSKGSYVILIEGTAAEINGAEAILTNRQILDWNIYNAPGNHNLMGI